ncbi:hypothetical protein HU200_014672 [Digitaria exilis]|uniref:Bifunctional inhibitor/plant lipid transfer protein/seed storage helical domain-containing protein n=1 Tax=Digitaria exilis TaxID=1010633 RepID=A0A835FCB9_9POAL|nr:hypothetical protein HU200_014672 [Digitaria exilis]
MAARAFFLLAAVVLVAAASASAQSSGSDDCTSALVSLSPCMDYISGNGTSSPSASCCSELKTVVQSKPQCLCAAIGGGSSSSLGGVTIDRDRALGLPAACNVQTPPTSQCNAVSLSLVAEREKGINRSCDCLVAGSSGGGSKATPSMPSGAAALRGPAGLVLGLAVAAVYAVSAAW